MARGVLIDTDRGGRLFSETRLEGEQAALQHALVHLLASPVMAEGQDGFAQSGHEAGLREGRLPVHVGESLDINDVTPRRRVFRHELPLCSLGRLPAPFVSISYVRLPSSVRDDLQICKIVGKWPASQKLEQPLPPSRAHDALQGL